MPECIHPGAGDEDADIGMITCPCLCVACLEYRVYWMGPPCKDCEWARTCDACVAEDEFNKYMDERVERLGWELAVLPDFMECYDCGRQHLMVMEDAWGFKYVLRRVAGLGPIVNQRQDPTQTYRLECGHGAM
jgi:hypothetical protein